MHQFNSGEDYSIPVWSAQPRFKYLQPSSLSIVQCLFHLWQSLEIIKNGVCIEEKDISYKPFILFGKYEDLCDVVLEHPTVSRKHAIMQSKNNGDIFMYDLGSSHGTYVNNKKLPSRVYHKMNAFDSIKFAQSTRVYILRCTELEEKDQQAQLDDEKEDKTVLLKPESGSKEVLGDSRVRSHKEFKEIYLNLRNNDPYYKQQNKKHKLKGGPVAEDENKENSQNEGISWGMSDEQEVYDYQDETQIALIPDLLRRLPNLNEKQVDKIDKYEEKLNKYRASEQELEGLTGKERKEYGLEDKLKVRKEKLQAKMLELQATLDQAESNVRLALFNESTDENDDGKKKRTFSKFEDNNPFDDDEEFFDKTQMQKKVKIDQAERKQIIMNNLENTTDNFWGLKQKLEKLINHRHELNTKVLNLNSTQSTTEEEEEDDDLEIYMKETNDKLNKDNRDKLFAKIIAINTEIQLVSDMLQHIKPDTQIDIEHYEKGLNERTNAFNEDEEDEGLVKKHSILKDDKVVKEDVIGQELRKLRELKQKRVEQQKTVNDKSGNNEINEDLIMKLAQEELLRQNKYEKSEEQYRQFQEEHCQQGEDAPLLVGTSDEIKGVNKIYKAATKPQSRNQKTSKQQEACVDLTYIESMDNYNEIYNDVMGKKFGY